MLRASLLALLLAAPAAAQTTASPVAWVAARELARGAVLADSDFVAPQGDAPRAPKPLGWTTRRLVRAGEPLREPTAAPPAMVARGSQVSLVMRSGALTLTLRGTALGDAALGRKVLVRVDARRRFEGTVVAPGVVRLDG